ncbi:hypothetical protein IFR04_015995, partial [Cadophora malorum]
MLERLVSLDSKPCGKYSPRLKVRGVRIGTIACQGAVFCFSDHDNAHRALLNVLQFFWSIDNGDHLSETIQNIHLPPDILA